MRKYWNVFYLFLAEYNIGVFFSLKNCVIKYVLNMINSRSKQTNKLMTVVENLDISRSIMQKSATATGTKLFSHGHHHHNSL